ncbi:MAG: hypothetical protein GY870_14130 [archaeon]|nr:hypothetical protein [archaeon]
MNKKKRLEEFGKYEFSFTRVTKEKRKEKRDTSNFMVYADTYSEAIHQLKTTIGIPKDIIEDLVLVGLYQPT